MNFGAADFLGKLISKLSTSDESPGSGNFETHFAIFKCKSILKFKKMKTNGIEEFKNKNQVESYKKTKQMQSTDQSK